MRVKRLQIVKWMHIVSMDGPYGAGVIKSVISKRKFSKKVIHWFDKVVDMHGYIGSLEAIRLDKGDLNMYKVMYRDTIGNMFYLRVFPIVE